MTGRYTHQHGVRYMEEVIDTTLELADFLSRNAKR